MKKTKPKKTSNSSNKSVVVSTKSQSGIQAKIQPLGSRVLIKPFTKEELTSKNSFGIILPDTGSKDKSEQGVVLAVGPGDYQDGDLIKTTIKVGERVVFSKYGYEDINVDGEELYLIKEENILAILK
ncbi:MAG: chaperonin GroES [Patescibacteria group bacterium]|jgi:chaperonin GroES|nr:chaperonin GroES [Patescibacteria group bacterium]